MVSNGFCKGSPRVCSGITPRLKPRIEASLRRISGNMAARTSPPRPTSPKTSVDWQSADCTGWIGWRLQSPGPPLVLPPADPQRRSNRYPGPKDSRQGAFPKQPTPMPIFEDQRPWPGVAVYQNAFARPAPESLPAGDVNPQDSRGPRNQGSWNPHAKERARKAFPRRANPLRTFQKCRVRLRRRIGF